MRGPTERRFSRSPVGRDVVHVADLATPTFIGGHRCVARGGLRQARTGLNIAIRKTRDCSESSMSAANRCGIFRGANRPADRSRHQRRSRSRTASDHGNAGSPGPADRSSRGAAGHQRLARRLAPVFDAVLEKAMRLCDAAFGMMRSYDGEHLETVAVLGCPMPMRGSCATTLSLPRGNAVALLARGHRSTRRRAAAESVEGRPAWQPR